MNDKPRSASNLVSDALGPGPGAQRLLRQRARLTEWEEARRRGGLFARLGFGSHSGLGGRESSRGLLLALGAMATLTLVLAFLLVRPAERAELVASLNHAKLEQNAWVTAAGTDQILSFSEGSEIAVAAGSRARVAALDASGLRVTLEAGKLEASITPKTGYRWVVQAGPHTVTVLGTVFSVEWSAEQARLQVAVKRGRVQVESNDGSQGASTALRMLEAGESLRVEPPSLSDARGAGVASAGVASAGVASADVASAGVASADVASAGVAGAGVPGAGVTEPPQAEQQPEDTGVAAPDRQGRSLKRATDPSRRDSSNVEPGVLSSGATGSAVEAPAVVSWKQLAEAGRYAEAVSAARGVGLSTLLGNTGATDLMLLADAARLGKAPDLAQQVLLTIRERHPGHPNATVAAFALGRLAFEVKRDDAGAIRWFETYLAASPNGSMAEGARGRLLRAWLRLGDKTKARAAAVEYLQHHPHGHHASVAQSLLGD